MRVLLAGESWVTHSVHVKGVDSFDTSTYVEGAGRLIEALGQAGLEVDYLPAHLVPARFPATAADLAAYGAIILSDIGANSLLLAPDTFERSAAAPNRLASVEQYVRDGGGLLMIGGYLSFAGIEGKARYHHTPVETALPVTISPHDDRAERPEGVHPAVTEPGHPVLAGVPGDWPALLGYNRLTGKSA
ncbi:MAG TPA: glutamine amidotransferase, partial [Streptosporangiaceae bacterium]|nr:glutamine amidotransferase [Streptosporangiaceae bacterium]